MKHFAIMMTLVLACSVVAGCSRTKAVILDEAHMSGAAFIQSTVSVKAGAPVKFIDNADGATHILVVGSNGVFDSTQTGAPPELSGAGLTISAGDTKPIVFPTAGTYTVTCTIHPAMLLTVTVT